MWPSITSPGNGLTSGEGVKQDVILLGQAQFDEFVDDNTEDGLHTSVAIDFIAHILGDELAVSVGNSGIRADRIEREGTNLFRLKIGQLLKRATLKRLAPNVRDAIARINVGDPASIRRPL